MTVEHHSSPRELLLGRIIEWFSKHGVLDTSMRSLATGVGTSNRMLNYHFGSRDDLLTEVIAAMCRSEREALSALVAECDDPFEAGKRYWEQVVATSTAFAPLFFELSSHTMFSKPYTEHLRTVLTQAWLEGFTAMFARSVDSGRADTLARLTLAVGRGVLFDLALTGDRAAADRAVATFTQMVRNEIANESTAHQPPLP